MSKSLGRTIAIALLLLSILTVPVLGQEKRLPTLDELALQNLNLRLRIMRLEFENLRQQRDRLQTKLDQQKSVVRKRQQLEPEGPKEKE